MYSLSLFFAYMSAFLLIRRLFCSVQHGVPVSLRVLSLYSTRSSSPLFFTPIFECSPQQDLESEQARSLFEFYCFVSAPATFNMLSYVVML